MKTKSTLMPLLLGTLIWLAACSAPSPAPNTSAEAAAGEANIAASPTAAPAATPTPANAPSGKLIFIQLDAANKTSLVQYDLATAEVSTLFTPADNGILLSADVSPDGNQIIMAYAPPTPPDEVQFGYTGLYIMPTQGAGDPQLLVEKELPDEVYFNPVWSPDGEAVYYTHMGPDPASAEGYFAVTLERLDMSTGEIIPTAPDAIWPRVSADGRRVTFAFSEPTSLRNELFVADWDGSHTTQLLNLDDFLAIDSPIFSPDGRTIYFSAVTPDTMTPQTSWWERLLGIKVASAHAIPSDWWRILADGSAPPERLTTIREVGLFGDFSPDGRYFAFISTASLYVMEPDSRNLTRLLDTETVGGALAWVP
ncbi:MAG: TolB family protein [Anaerolineae bacterium]